MEKPTWFKAMIKLDSIQTESQKTLYVGLVTGAVLLRYHPKQMDHEEKLSASSSL